MLNRLLAPLRRANWRLVIAALFAVGILHILATLAAPTLATSRGYDRITGGLPLNRMQVVPPITASTQLLPYMAPDARYAVCRFDTTDGTVALSASLPGPGWLVALYSTAGDNFFTSVAQPDRRTEVSLLLVPSEDRLTTMMGGPLADTTETSATLTVAAPSGLAIIRAPDQGPSYAARNLAELKRAACSFRKT